MLEPQTFETTPIRVDAMLLDDTNAMEVYQWIAANTKGIFAPEDVAVTGSGVSIDPSDGQIVIASMRGTFKPEIGDFVIKVPGATGQFTKMPYQFFVEAHRVIGEDFMPGMPVPQPPQDDSESPYNQETPDEPVAVDETPEG